MTNISDAEFAEDYAENGLEALFDNGWRGIDFADQRSELARFLTANETLIDSWAEFLDLLDAIVDTVLDGGV